MAEKLLMKGNEAIAEAAIVAGCRYYFGYPITPQTEIAAYMSARLPGVGGVFIQAESEMSAINMVIGAASAGARVMTSSSSPGISLKQEGLSFIAGCELPCVLANIVRAGPGLGGILPGQCDYFQAVKGGGHGDYRNVAIAPWSVQEMFDLTIDAFDIADRYRVAVIIMGDGMLGQIMEPVEIKERPAKSLPGKEWALTGNGLKRKSNIVNSLYIIGEELEALNNKLQSKYAEIGKNETRCGIYNCENADIIVTAFGTTARIVKNVIKTAEKEGIRMGLIRPITLWPFPDREIAKFADTPRAFLSVEMNAGQMVEDVRLAVNGRKPVYFHGRTGGMVPTQQEILDKIKEILGKAR